MEALLDGETKVVVRERRGVIWCPFCDRSMMIQFAAFCSGCNAEFKSTSEEEVQNGAPAPAPRRRRRASESEAEADDVTVPDVVVEEIEETPAEE